jgi:hypothetical protein
VGGRSGTDAECAVGVAVGPGGTGTVGSTVATETPDPPVPAGGGLPSAALQATATVAAKTRAMNRKGAVRRLAEQSIVLG